MKRYYSLLMALILLLVLAIPAAAQDAVPSVTVSDQASLDGTVWVTSAYSAGPGFIVIHIQENDAPGPVAGFRWVNPGWNFNIQIPIDNSIITPTLYAMLHVDDNIIGTYEFGTVEGADAPVAVDGNVVTPAFAIEAITPNDQFVADDGTVTIASVTTQADGWLVIHAEQDGTFGPVLGQTLISAGTTANVSVSLAADGRTPVLWPMTHVDTGTIGTYEFGAVEGADGPVVVNGVVASMPIWTIPHIRVNDQIVLRADGAAVTDVAPTAVAISALSDGPGFLVFHQEENGSFGPVAGVSQPLPDGLSTNIVVTMTGTVTPRLWPMLHVDTGTVGTYEFGTVEGADSPVVIDGNVVSFPINAAPSITYEGSLEGNQLTVSGALMDVPGWLAIHSNNNGQPGPVIGNAPLMVGDNSNIVVQIDPAAAGNLVFPMLHVDTGTPGVYEFGSVDGADLPVSVGGGVVVGPLNLGGTTTDTTDTAAPTTDCTLTPAGSGAVNIRGGTGTGFAIVGSVAPGQSVNADAQAPGANGNVWWRVVGGGWIRSDVVIASDGCASLPAVDASEAAPPAATEEAG